MDIFDWFQIIAAVFAGNCLTVWFFYFFWCAHQNQKRGLDPYDVPIPAILGGLVGPLFSAAVVYFM